MDVFIPDQLAVQIIDHTGILFANQCVSISSTNDVGPFDVLASHCNFICMVQSKLTLQIDKGSTYAIEAVRGILHCTNNRVDIYLEEHGAISQ